MAFCNGVGGAGTKREVVPGVEQTIDSGRQVFVVLRVVGGDLDIFLGIERDPDIAVLVEFSGVLDISTIIL